MTKMSNKQATFLEVNLNYLKNNFNFLKSKISSQTKLLVVLKAYAYGSNPIKVAQFFENLRVDYFAVAYFTEAIKLVDSGIKTPILIFHPQPNNFKHIINNFLIPTIYSINNLTLFKKSLVDLGVDNYPVHIKINTGLNRIGFDKNEINSLISDIAKDNLIKIVGIYSHLAASEDLKEIPFSTQQINCFTEISKKISSKLKCDPILHLCNTSGILNFPNAHFNMVRTGIGVYGFSNGLTNTADLSAVISLKSSISQIHKIKKGESVGYNRGFIAEKDITSATIPLGHADGISRIYGNGKGFVFINNYKAFILGNVCMDMIMVDITNIDCSEGDQVIIFDNLHTAEKLAESAGTISYELLTALSQRIERKFININ